MNLSRCVIAILFLASLFPAAARAHDPRVLIIGFDGCRSDALAKAQTPEVDKLVAAGALFDQTLCLPPQTSGEDSISGPGWSSMLTGVWSNKHGVQDNKFTVKHYEQYPHFFVRLKESRPDAVTYSVAHWAPIAEHVVAGADTNDTAATDDEAEAKIIAALADKDPVAAFVHFNDPDSTGHSKGFSPAVPEYIAAIQTLDARVGRMMAALHQRPKFADEDWLILISTDHGGEGTSHSGGVKNPVMRTMFIVASGSGIQAGDIDRQTYIVDVAATALAHLQIEFNPDWKLDGTPLQKPQPAPQPSSAPAGQAKSQQQDKKPFVPTEQYRERNLLGWKVMINKDLTAKDSKVGAQAVKLLEAKLKAITEEVPAEAVKKLQQVTIWLGVNDGNAPCAEYHPSRQWLIDHGFNPDKAKCVEIGCAEKFIAWSKYQPAMILHELSHAYQDQVLGNDCREIKDAFAAAVASHAYEKVDHVQGKQQRHYGLNNPQEFFAEATEAYFDRNDFYPFTRAELRQHDPKTYAVVEQVWGVK